MRAGRNAPARGGNPRKNSQPSQNPVSAARTKLSSLSGVTGLGNKVTNGHAASTSLDSVAVAKAVPGAVGGVGREVGM